MLFHQFIKHQQSNFEEELSDCDGMSESTFESVSKDKQRQEARQLTTELLLDIYLFRTDLISKEEE